MTRNKLTILVIVILLAIGCFWFFTRSTSPEVTDVMDTFDDKIVYTTDMSLEEDEFRADCKEAGGLFNPCGSPCPTYVDSCAQVCAYTCEDL